MYSRNKNIDILRSAALLLVLLYHAWVVCGSVPTRFSLINCMVSLGGEIGVTAFFALSGYGIYCSLRNMELHNSLHYLPFLKKRALRIMPQYYFCLFFVLLCMDGAYYIAREHIGNILSHIFFLHNLFPDHFGAINGVLWTMGVIVQFYIFSILLYKGTRKFGLSFYVAGILFTILCKFIMYRYVLPAFTADSSLNFFAGRQLITALDNFLVGMAAAYFVQEKPWKLNKAFSMILFLLEIVLLVVICKTGQHYGIHTANLSGYVWHSAVALLLGLMMITFSNIQLADNCKLWQFLLWLSRFEYGIYLWHLVIYRNLLGKAPGIQALLSAGHHKAVMLILIIVSIPVGILTTRLIDQRAASAPTG